MTVRVEVCLENGFVNVQDGWGVERLYIVYFDNELSESLNLKGRTNQVSL